MPNKNSPKAAMSVQHQQTSDNANVEHAVVSDAGIKNLGYRKVDTLATVKGITDIPAGARVALIAISGAGIYFRDDGTDPTATDSMPCDAGEKFPYNGEFSKLKFLQQASGAVVHISFYG